MGVKQYVVATDKMSSFLVSISGKYGKLALVAGLNARTIARIRNGERTSSGTARDLYRASKSKEFGYVGGFESAFISKGS